MNDELKVSVLKEYFKDPILSSLLFSLILLPIVIDLQSIPGLIMFLFLIFLEMGLPLIIYFNHESKMDKNIQIWFKDESILINEKKINFPKSQKYNIIREEILNLRAGFMHLHMTNFTM